MDIPKEILEKLECTPKIGEKPQFKAQLEKCPDCDRIVENRVLDFLKMNEGRLWWSHWKIKCRICKFYQNPATGEFDVDRMKQTELYRQFHRKDK